jgi:hypothetical protein
MKSIMRGFKDKSLPKTSEILGQMFHVQDIFCFLVLNTQQQQPLKHNIT